MKANFDQQIDTYMIYCKTRQLRPKTMLSYERTLRLFEKWCKEEMNVVFLDDVTENTIRYYIAQIQERGKYTFYADDSKKSINVPQNRKDYRQEVSITTINNYLRNLKAFFNWLDAQHILGHNPMRNIRLLKNERKGKAFMEDEEFLMEEQSREKAV